MTRTTRICKCGGTRDAEMMGPTFSRREMLQSTGLGFGSLALACLLNGASPLRAEIGADRTKKISYNDLKPRPSHFPGPAKAAILLYQEGGPSQMDLFDPKPELTRRNGQPHPAGVEIATADTNKNALLASPFRFRRHGECGMELSEILPCLG